MSLIFGDGCGKVFPVSTAEKFWLNKFVQEVGDRYAPRSLYGIVCGLKRHLKDKNGGKALNPLDGSYKRYFSRSCALVQSALHDIKSL